jgi:hypothetical protein
VHWVLSHADLFLISPSDGEVLPHLLRAASQPAVAPSDEEMRAQVAAQEMRALYP